MKLLQTLFTVILVLMLCVSLYGQGETLHKSFSVKKADRIGTVSGDCIIKTGTAGKVVKGGKTPEIHISTAGGRAVLK